MSEQVELVPGLYVDPIPEPQVQVKRLMLATAILIDGYLNTEPQQFHPYLGNCFLAPQAGIIIAGTRCPRPLMIREMTNVGKTVERDAVVVRFSGERGACALSFDVHLFASEQPLLGYRLWMPQPTGSAWLIPTVVGRAFVRFAPDGFEVDDKPPFVDAFDRHRGLVWASEFLSVATTGWF